MVGDSMYLFIIGIIKSTAKITLPMKKRPQNILKNSHQMEAENIRNSNDENKIFENRVNWSEDGAILINSQRSHPLSFFRKTFFGLGVWRSSKWTS